MMMRILTIALLSSLAAPLSSAFQTAPGLMVQQRASTAIHMASEEERAAALSDYLAKAHEEKLKAIQSAEAKKEIEIQALKAQVEELRAQKPAGSPSSALTSSATPASSDLADFTKEELVNKVTQYQAFMSKYIVNAQEEKANAVKAAQHAADTKYGLLLSGGAAAAAPASAKPVLSKEEGLFAKRNAAVSAASAAGKSRWGDMEAQRTAGGVGALQSNGAAPATAFASAPAPSLVVPPEVEAADHGLRADGGVGGLTLAERVTMGANAGSGSAAAAISPEEISYRKRSARIAAAAAAGKSRWGAMENERAQQFASLPAGSSSQPVAALEERVNLGARILSK